MKLILFYYKFTNPRFLFTRNMFDLAVNFLNNYNGQSFFCNMIKLTAKYLYRASNSFWQSFNRLKSTFNTHWKFHKKLFTSYKIGVIFADKSSCVNILTKKEGSIIYYQNIISTNMLWYRKLLRVPLLKQVSLYFMRRVWSVDIICMPFILMRLTLTLI